MFSKKHGRERLAEEWRWQLWTCNPHVTIKIFSNCDDLVSAPISFIGIGPHCFFFQSHLGAVSILILITSEVAMAKILLAFLTLVFIQFSQSGKKSGTVFRLFTHVRTSINLLWVRFLWYPSAMFTSFLVLTVANQQFNEDHHLYNW